MKLHQQTNRVNKVNLTILQWSSKTIISTSLWRMFRNCITWRIKTLHNNRALLYKQTNLLANHFQNNQIKSIQDLGYITNEVVNVKRKVTRNTNILHETNLFLFFSCVTTIIFYSKVCFSVKWRRVLNQFLTSAVFDFILVDAVGMYGVV